MNKISRVIASGVSVVGVSLLLTGCFGSPAPSKTIAAAPGTAISAQPADQASQTPGKSTPLTQAQLGGIAAQQFPDVKATTNHSAAEIQQALFSITQELQIMHNTHALLDGVWATTGYTPSYAGERFSGYFTDEAYEHYIGDVTDMDSNTDHYNAVLVLTPSYKDGGSDYTLCYNSALTCEMPGYPKFTDMTYGETQAGGLYIQLTMTDRLAVQTGGKTGYLPSETKLYIVAQKNANYNTKNGSFPYVIAGWKGSYARSNAVVN